MVATDAAPMATAGARAGAHLEGRAVLIRAPFYQVGPLVLVDCASRTQRVLDDGPCYGACFSPDGRRVAYSRDGAIYVREIHDGAEGRAEEVTMVAGNNFLYWTETDYLYFGQHPERVLYRAHVGQKVREVVFTSNHSHLNAISVSRNGRKAAWSNPTYVHGQKPTWAVKVWDIVGKPAEREIGPGAKGTISPNGELVTRGLDDSGEVAIHRFADGAELGRVAPPEGTLNGARFSHSSDQHIVYTLVGSLTAYVHDLRSGQQHLVGEGVITDAYVRG